MSRIRTVKPELFRHEELFEAELRFKLPLRLAFIGLFSVCDREGRFRWRPRQLKLDILPYDEIDFGLILDALEEAGFIKSYEVDGKRYGYIPSWHKHQVINQRETASVIPTPNSVDTKTLLENQLDKSNNTKNDIKTPKMPAVNSSPQINRLSMDDEINAGFQFDENDIDDDPDDGAYYDSEDVADDVGPHIITEPDRFPKTKSNPTVTALELEQRGRVASQPFASTTYDAFSLTVGFNNNTSYPTLHTEVFKGVEANSTAIDVIQVTNQTILPSSKNLNAPTETCDLNLHNEFSNSKTDSFSNLSGMCTHVHAHACTWGIGREVEKEMELEVEQEWEGEVRRGREICAKQTYPPRLADIVAQARRRSGDPPTGLSASELKNPSQAQPKLVSKKINFWKLPMGDPLAKWKPAEKIFSKPNDNAVKENSLRGLTNAVAPTQPRSCGPPGELNADNFTHSNKTLRKVVSETYTENFEGWRLLLGHLT